MNVMTVKAMQTSDPVVAIAIVNNAGNLVAYAKASCDCSAAAMTSARPTLLPSWLRIRTRTEKN